MGVDVRSDGGLDRIPRRHVHARLTEREKGKLANLLPRAGQTPRGQPLAAKQSPYLHGICTEMHWFSALLSSMCVSLHVYIV